MKDRLRAVVGEVASGQRQNAGELTALLERNVRLLLSRHHGDCDLTELTGRRSSGSSTGVAPGELDDPAQLGADTRRVALAAEAKDQKERPLIYGNGSETRG
jgi:hypothetical protein